MLTEFCAAQNDSLVHHRRQKDTLPYNRKQELVYDTKRYRKYNNYITFGGGPLYSTVRAKDQKVLAADFNFHLQKNYFQFGFLMSGADFLANNNVQGHICFGKRYETEKMNLAVFAGPSLSKFVVAKQDSTGSYYPEVTDVLGGYICLQAIYKIKYDVGIGGEIFGDFSSAQQFGGLKIIVFFSGAYRGQYRGFKSMPKTKKP